MVCEVNIHILKNKMEIFSCGKSWYLDRRPAEPHNEPCCGGKERCTTLYELNSSHPFLRDL
jgi:hypothetical protein